MNTSERAIPIPVGWDITPLDLKLTDAQFLEIRKYSALQVAAAFGIKPNFLNDYDKSSYSNAAAQNLSFYTDTLLYIITLYEQEFSRKLLTTEQLNDGIRVHFNFPLFFVRILLPRHRRLRLMLQMVFTRSMKPGQRRGCLR